MRTSARYPVFEARFPPRVRFISPSEETTDARPAATLIPQFLFSLASRGDLAELLFVG